MYAQAWDKSVNAVRSIILKQMVGEDEKLTSKSRVDLSRLPPCRDNPVPHIYRVNHRIAPYKRADKAIFCSPTILDKAGRRRTRAPWSKCGHLVILLPSLIDLLEKTLEEVEKEEEHADQEIDYDEIHNDDE